MSARSSQDGKVRGRCGRTKFVLGEEATVRLTRRFEPFLDLKGAGDDQLSDTNIAESERMQVGSHQKQVANQQALCMHGTIVQDA
jgi:hypothetical protein